MIIKGTLACTLGAGLLCVALVSARTNITLMLQGETTFGNVCSYQIHGAGKQATFGARAKFTHNGEIYRTHPETFSNKKRYRIDEMVRVLYLEDKPDQARIAAEVGIGAPTLVPAAIGILALMFGIGALTGRVAEVE